jgi:pyruvate dehydrogenase (quinone)
MVDPDVPPLPPHIALKQAKAFGTSLLKGELTEPGLVKQTLQHLIPSLGDKSS